LPPHSTTTTNPPTPSALTAPPRSTWTSATLPSPATPAASSRPLQPCHHGHRRQPRQGQPHHQVRRQCLVTVQLRLRPPNGLRPLRLPLQLWRGPMRDPRLPGTDAGV
ncbi:hypothetical protein LINPERPRIM_LOCUS37548, partial [Linum perenne]